MTVFMLIVADLVPASSEKVPLLGLYFTAVMIEIVLMVLAMCYILKLHCMNPVDGEEIGHYMRVLVFDYLSFKLKIRDSTNKGRKRRRFWGSNKGSRYESGHLTTNSNGSTRWSTRRKTSNSGTQLFNRMNSTMNCIDGELATRLSRSSLDGINEEVSVCIDAFYTCLGEQKLL